MIEIAKKEKKVLYAIIISCIFVFWTQRKIFFVATGVGYRILEILFSICMIIALTWMIYYLVIEDDDIVSKKVRMGYYLKLLAVQVCAFLPMYTQNFLYGDDLWGFASEFDGNLSTGLHFSRPFFSFLYGTLTNTSYTSIRYFRVYNGIILFLFGCIVFRYITTRVRDCKVAFLFSAIAIAGCTAVDCIAYASVFPINSSLVLSAISFIIYLKARTSSGRYKIILLLESGLCLFAGFCMYQIGTPIVFLLYVINEKYSLEENERERFGKALLYLVYYGIVAISYLLANNVLQTLVGMKNELAARGTIITSIDLYIKKLDWFIFEVCPQALTRLISNLFGSAFFTQNNMFYGCKYMSRGVEGTFIAILMVFVIISIGATAYRKKSFVYAVLSVLAIPLSFWPFLVLPESTFLTYYAIAIILLFLWYVIDGLVILSCGLFKILSRFIKNGGNIGEKVIGMVVVIVALQSNYYAENAWVNYCRDSYEYIADTLLLELDGRDDIDTIIVNGTINPYVGLGDYVKFCVQDALNELGYDANQYNIVPIDNGYFLWQFWDSDLAGMEQILGDDRMSQLLQYYNYDELYGVWYYCGTITEQSELDFLKECFVSTGQLVVEDESTISIDMKGFNMRNSF